MGTKYNAGLDVLKNFICITKWSPYWRENIGLKGEEHLANIYREVLPNP